jgi:radical SAM protein with 4Fe4S-binding SPASM domain
MESLDNYRPSRFLIRKDIDSGFLLYNTATGCIVQLQGDEDVVTSLHQLIKMYFYVPIDFDELSWVDKQRQLYREKENKTIDSYTIITTLDCNARCFYCYEKGQPRIHMSNSTANDIVDFIVKNAKPGLTQDIRWFGGEPLINEKVIDLICGKLANQGVHYRSRMISNGLLFNEINISKAKNSWNLKKVQITLDGTEKIYQKAKSYVNATGEEFQRVLNNIEALLKAKIQVVIRLNQDLYNTEDLLCLVELLSKKFKGKRGLSVYNSLLFTEEKETQETSLLRYESFLKLQDRIIENNLQKYKEIHKYIKIRHCMADNDSSIIIGPTGKIGKCEHYSNEFLIGSIYKEGYDTVMINKWKETYDVKEKCHTCPLYPQCVRIKMCPEEHENCSMEQCENKIHQLRMSMEVTYNRFTKEKNEAK